MQLQRQTQTVLAVTQLVVAVVSPREILQSVKYLVLTTTSATVTRVAMHLEIAVQILGNCHAFVSYYYKSSTCCPNQCLPSPSRLYTVL